MNHIHTLKNTAKKVTYKYFLNTLRHNLIRDFSAENFKHKYLYIYMPSVHKKMQHQKQELISKQYFWIYIKQRGAKRRKKQK